MMFSECVCVCDWSVLLKKMFLNGIGLMHLVYECHVCRFVFCDGGSKKHPKLYGFQTESDAARAFDVLTLKRALEKGDKNVGEILATDEERRSLDLNHPYDDYRNDELLAVINETSRDDLIYGLRQLSRARERLAIEELVEKLQQAVVEARMDNEQRLSYAPNVLETRIAYERKKTQRDRSGVQTALKRGKKDGEASEQGIREQIRAIAQAVNRSQEVTGHHLQSLPTDANGDISYNGNNFAIEVCRLAASSCPELLCAADLIRIWEMSQQRKDISDQELLCSVETMLGSEVYANHIESLKPLENLSDVLAYCFVQWHAKELYGILADFVTASSEAWSAANDRGVANLGDSGMGHAMSHSGPQTQPASGFPGNHIPNSNILSFMQSQLAQFTGNFNPAAAGGMGMPSGQLTFDDGTNPNEYYE